VNELENGVKKKFSEIESLFYELSALP